MYCKVHISIDSEVRTVSPKQFTLALIENRQMYQLHAKVCERLQNACKLSSLSVTDTSNSPAIQIVTKIKITLRI